MELLDAIDHCGGPDRLYIPGSDPNRKLSRQILCDRANYVWTGYRRHNVSHFIDVSGHVVALKARQGQSNEGSMFKSAVTADMRDLASGSTQLTNHVVDGWIALCACLLYRNRVVGALVVGLVSFLSIIIAIIIWTIRRH